MQSELLQILNKFEEFQKSQEKSLSHLEDHLRRIEERLDKIETSNPIKPIPQPPQPPTTSSNQSVGKEEDNEGDEKEEKTDKKTPQRADSQPKDLVAEEAKKKEQRAIQDQKRAQAGKD